MPVLEYKLLSLGTKNSTIAAFETLVDDSLGLLEDSSNDTHAGNSLPVVHIKELDQDLYDKAAGLPEAKTVSFKYLDDASKYQYGNFKGGNVYKSYDGDIDSSKKNVKEQKGWIILDKSSKDYCLFTNGNSDTIVIAIKDFEPTPVIEDFTPLYDKLKQRQYIKDESCSDDTHLTTSLAATFKEDVSKLVREISPKFKFTEIDSSFRTADWYSTANDILFNLWKMYMAAYMSVGEFSLFIKKISDKENLLSKSYDLFPEQIGWDKDKYRQIANTSSFNDINAVIYDIPSDGKYSSDDAISILLCYQQPESISYTASAAYEQSTPRGSQQPYQFYTNANQIELTFDLEWHIDEVRTLGKKGTKESYSLQDIAQAAEDFTRPWADENTGAIKPKLCGVILPGISEIGYITTAIISYTGSMAGDFSTGSGVLTGLDNNYSYKAASIGKDADGNSVIERPVLTNYCYSELKVSFTMVVVKDIKLLTTNATDGVKTTILNNKSDTSTSDVFQGIMNGAADVMAYTGGLADAMKQMSEATANIVSILT